MLDFKETGEARGYSTNTVVSNYLIKWVILFLNAAAKHKCLEPDTNYRKHTVLDLIRKFQFEMDLK